MILQKPHAWDKLRQWHTMHSFQFILFMPRVVFLAILEARLKTVANEQSARRSPGSVTVSCYAKNKGRKQLGMGHSWKHIVEFWRRNECLENLERVGDKMNQNDIQTSRQATIFWKVLLVNLQLLCQAQAWTFFHQCSDTRRQIGTSMSSSYDIWDSKDHLLMLVGTQAGTGSA